MHLDALLVDQPLAGGLEPKLGFPENPDHHGFPEPDPSFLDDLNRLAMPYRWSTRAILLDKTDATKVLTKIRRQWFAKRKSIAAIVREVMTNEASVLVDNDAANKAADADLACSPSVPTMSGRPYHRDHHGLGRLRLHRGRKASAGREDHPGPRLHLHDGKPERRGGVAGISARSCLRQCPSASGLDPESGPYDPAVGRLGGPERDGHFKAPPLFYGKTAGPRRSGSRCMSAMSATR
jgi:type IV secretion system protein VirB4